MVKSPPSPSRKSLYASDQDSNTPEMNKQTLIFSVVFVLLCLIGCKVSKQYTDHYAPLKTDSIMKITIEIQSDTVKCFTIADKQEIKDFITDINNSTVNGPWKGAKWDKIVIHYDEGEKVFSTNGKVFGQGSSGTFYNLNDKYKHYWKK